MHASCVQFPQRPEADVRAPGAGVTDGWELPCGCWEPTQGILVKCSLTSEPSSSQPPSFISLIGMYSLNKTIWLLNIFHLVSSVAVYTCLD